MTAGTESDDMPDFDASPEKASTEPEPAQGQTMEHASAVAEDKPERGFSEEEQEVAADAAETASPAGLPTQDQTVPKAPATDVGRQERPVQGRVFGAPASSQPAGVGDPAQRGRQLTKTPLQEDQPKWRDDTPPRHQRHLYRWHGTKQ
eukprot:539765-Amphidinium_carterae.1